MEQRKKTPVMVRLSDEDRDWIRKQAQLLEDLTGSYSESAVVRLVIRRFREGISAGIINWDLGKASEFETSVRKKRDRSTGHH